MIQKLNMVIGTFFSEVGIELLHRFSDFVDNADQLEREVDIHPSWDKKEFHMARSKAEDFKYSMNFKPEKMEEKVTNRRLFGTYPDNFKIVYHKP